MIVGALIDGQNYTVKDLFSHAENRQRRYEEAMRLSRKYSQPSEEGQATAKSEEIKDEVILSSEAQDLIKSRPNNETEVAPEDQSAQELMTFPPETSPCKIVDMDIVMRRERCRRSAIARNR